MQVLVAESVGTFAGAIGPVRRGYAFWATFEDGIGDKLRWVS